MSVPRKTPCPTQKGVKRGYLFFFTERDWNRGCCHGNNIVEVNLFLLWCTFLVPSLKITAPIFLEIFLIQYFIVSRTIYDVITRLHNTKTWISLKQKRIFQKGKCYSTLFWKAFQMSSNYFLLHRHFNSETNASRVNLFELLSSTVGQ